jgi:TonB family protein
MRFTPAQNRGRAVPVWVQIPITFTAPAARGARSAGQAPSAEPVTHAVAGYQSPPSSVEPERQSALQGGLATVIPSRIEIPAPSLSMPRFDLGRFAPRLDPPRMRATRPITAGPMYTPYTLKPELVNSQEIARSLQRRYPPLLRDSGVGGTTVLWFLIDDRGTVQKKQIFRPSGHRQLDDAALAVAEQMRFRPAENRGQKVPVWVQIPVTFSSR